MLTEEKLIESIREMKRMIPRTKPAAIPFNGMPIVYSEYALKETAQRLFPASKNRSRRIHKKLVKRFGGEFRKVPTMWVIGGKIVAHPSFQSQLEANTVRKETGPCPLLSPR